MLDDLDGTVTLNGDDLASGILASKTFNPTNSKQGYRSPTLSQDDLTVFGSVGNSLASFPTPSATLNWQTQMVTGDVWLSESVVVGPSAAAPSGVGAVGVQAGLSICYDATDGSPVWQFSFSSRISSMFLISQTEGLVFGTDRATTGSNAVAVAKISTVEATPMPSAPTTEIPTYAPTRAPTGRPTVRPTMAPTRRPTVAPTRRPTVAPSQSPTRPPTRPTTSSVESKKNVFVGMSTVVVALFLSLLM